MARGYRQSGGGRGGSAKSQTSNPKKQTAKGQVRNGKVVQYSIKDAQNNTKYVGTTNNPRRRAAQHKESGKVQAGDRLVVETRGVSRQQAEGQEGSKLETYRWTHGRNPEHNKTPDGKYHQRRMF